MTSMARACDHSVVSEQPGQPGALRIAAGIGSSNGIRATVLSDLFNGPGHHFDPVFADETHRCTTGCSDNRLTDLHLIRTPSGTPS
ncbi:hypothetical protein I546_2724 [Mycobacterium kansasii 732]|nr:hypothetical protein I546_2724 [Mycobacterium kansasii 732]